MKIWSSKSLLRCVEQISGHPSKWLSIASCAINCFKHELMFKSKLQCSIIVSYFLSTEVTGNGGSFNTDLFICTKLLFTDLNPCLNVHCPSFGVCKTYGAHDARCVCYEDCPSYQDPVCTANGTTYDNRCWHQLSYCRGLENNLVYHPGSCEGEQLRLLIT